ncbi:hypothetical protein AciM339_1075 [Aciduliprofundum sp. MAR08-339]|uniref:hypothetical protein n=1 Tax=Aciduliprofundum sp. (strain MAR08-339) TaxID=673860 RepID=UPI0002A4B774|nr:hypothetical protein AciM339_1075 [Aciduliprofundum sp. MAR08-339]
MKRLLSIGLVVILSLSILASTAIAQENQKWGFKLNVNLKDQLQPYVKVLTDMLVSKFNHMNSTYQINSYDSSLNGTFRMAEAMMATGNGIEYEGGEYTNANLSFYANGVFPYATNVSQVINGSVEPKNLNISAMVSLITKHLSNGTVIESTPGNVSKIISNSYNYFRLHFKGKNIPLSLILYPMIESKAVRYQDLSIRMDLNYISSMSNLTNICLKTYLNETLDGIPINSTIKTSDVYVNSSLVSVNVIDQNHDGYLDTGDYLCLHINPSFFNQFSPVELGFKTSFKGHSYHFSVSLMPQEWSASLDWDFYVPVIVPRYEKLLNEVKSLPLYDNFNFTILAEVQENTTTTYNPSLPLIPKSRENITMVTRGKYYGTITIVGLQEKYKKILENVLNLTFPINLQTFNTHIPGFSNGTINKSTRITVAPMRISGTMEYGGENVYIVHLNIPKENSIPNFDFWYFYSPSKKFIVGGGVQIGTKKFDTQAITYSNAQKEIDSMKNVKGGGAGILNTPENPWLMPTVIGIAVLVVVLVIIAIVAAVLKKRRSP